MVVSFHIFTILYSVFLFSTKTNNLNGHHESIDKLKFHKYNYIVASVFE